MKRVNPLSGNVFCVLVAATLCVSSIGCRGDAGFLGLQDYQRDLLSMVGGGLAGALLSGLPDGQADGDQAGLADPGPPGPQGPEGPPGPPIFAIFVDTFFSGEFDEFLAVEPMRNEEPQLGAGDGPLAFSVSIPNHYDGANPINMRVVAFRSGPCTSDCFVFSVDARRLQVGSATPDCFGGVQADCADGTRWIGLDGLCSEAEDPDDVSAFLLIDLPLDEGGLQFPQVAAGDFLAFELNTFSADGGVYQIIGVEFSNADSAPVPTATIYSSLQEIPEGCASAP